ncbi:MAG: homocysteine S-methyltransferase family protein [Acidimicrobiales bacterium]
MTSSDFLLLDGGMGKALEAQGAPFRQPEWSALALMEDPESVVTAHCDFIAAGADAIISSNYAVVPFHLGEQRFDERCEELSELSGRLARRAADSVDRPVLVAGSLPPLFGSYEPDLFDAERAPELLARIASSLAPFVDLFVAETQSCLAEARASLLVAATYEVPRWVSYTLTDELVDGHVELRSGESTLVALAIAEEMGSEAILFNCSSPEVMELAIREVVANRSTGIVVGAYANAFEPRPQNYSANEALLDHRVDLDPGGYRRFVESWLHAGAGIVGGCCGIMAHHIEELATLKP